MTTLQEALEAIESALPAYIDFVPSREYLAVVHAALAQQGEQRCTYCDGTGDVHGIDGEWRGTCPCAAAPAPQAPFNEPDAAMWLTKNKLAQHDLLSAPQAQDKSDNYLIGYCTGRTDLLKEQSAQPVAQPLTDE